MDVLKAQSDDQVSNLWHLQIGGFAGDGKYRLARFGAETDDPQQWMFDHQAEVQAAIDVGQRDPVRETRPDLEMLAGEADAEIGWLNETIPQIDTMAAVQVRDVVKRLAQENLRQIKAWKYIFRRLA